MSTIHKSRRNSPIPASDPGFDVTPDGPLVALMAPSGSLQRQPTSNVTVVLKFFSEVKQQTLQ